MFRFFFFISAFSSYILYAPLCWIAVLHIHIDENFIQQVFVIIYIGKECKMSNKNNTKRMKNYQIRNKIKKNAEKENERSRTEIQFKAKWKYVKKLYGESWTITAQLVLFINNENEMLIFFFFFFFLHFMNAINYCLKAFVTGMKENDAFRLYKCSNVFVFNAAEMKIKKKNENRFEMYNFFSIRFRKFVLITNKRKNTTKFLRFLMS